MKVRIRYRDRPTPHRKSYERATYTETQVVDEADRIIHRCEFTHEAEEWCRANGHEIIPGDTSKAKG